MSAPSSSRNRPRYLKSLAAVSVVVSVVVVSLALASPVRPRPGDPAMPIAGRLQLDARFGGQVTDTEGNPLAGVKITLENLGRGGVIELVSDEEGRFFRRGIPLDLYRLRFEKDGFGTVEDEIRMRSGMNSFDATMEALDPVATGGIYDAYTRGYEAFQEGRYPEAIAAMREVLAGLEDPEADDLLVSAWTAIGRSHLELEQYPEAIDAYEQLLELRPDNVDAHLDIGMAYSRQGEAEKANEHFRQALDLSPDDPLASYNVGVMMLRAGEVEVAIEALEQAISLRPEYPLAHKSLGYAYARAEEYEEALGHFETYLEQEPEAEDAEQIREFIEWLRQQIK